MTNRNGIKTAAIISCIIFALWVLLILVTYVFQNNILGLFYNGPDIVGETDRVIIWGNIVQSLFIMPIILSCYMIIKEKGGALPMIISGIASVLMPVVTSVANVVQNMLSAHINGASALVRLSVAHNAASWLAYLLNAACLIAVAASAVHFYAYKNGEYNKEGDIG